MLLEGAVFCDDLKVAISSSLLPALDDVLTDNGAWLCLGLDCVTLSCRDKTTCRSLVEVLKKHTVLISLTKYGSSDCEVDLSQPHASIHMPD